MWEMRKDFCLKILKDRADRPMLIHTEKYNIKTDGTKIRYRLDSNGSVQYKVFLQSYHEYSCIVKGIYFFGNLNISCLRKTR
jgi:hypothetical protein